MSEDGGLLFTQIPELKTPTKDWDEFWENYIPKNKMRDMNSFLDKAEKRPPEMRLP